MKNKTTYVVLDNLGSFIPNEVRMLRMVFVVVVSGLGVIGNTLVGAVMVNVRDKNSTDWLVLFMSITDLYASLVLGFTFFCRDELQCWERISGNFACRFHFMSVTIAYVSSSMLLTTIAIDRYFKTCNPLSGKLTTKQSKVACVSILIASAVFSLPSLSYTWDDRHGACIIQEDFAFLTTFSSGVSMIFFCVMFAVVLLCYKKIYSFLRRRYNKRGHLGMIQFGRHNRIGIGENIHNAYSPNMPNTSQQMQTGGTSSTEVEKIFTDSKKTKHFNNTTVSGAVKYVHVTANSIFNAPICVQGSSNRPNKSECESSTSSQQMSEREQRQKEIDQMKSVCRMMSSITLTFITTWLASFLVGLLWSIVIEIRLSVFGSSLTYVIGVFYMINCISNPFFYVRMSSVFRQRLIKTVCKK